MFRYRLLSALVLIPLVVGLTFLGNGWFLALVIAVLTLAGYEYAQITRHGGVQTSAVLVIGFVWLALLATHYRALGLLWPTVAAFALITTLWALARFERGAATAALDWAFTLAGGLYLGWTSAHFILLRNMGIHPGMGISFVDEGLDWTVLALACVWLTDTSAYAVGKLIGRRKMAPRLSPSKTWEGYAGGLLGGALMGAAMPWIFDALHMNQPHGLTIGHSAAIGLLIAALTPLGDLGESMLKRWANVKDSGSLIPGHGGMFDRLDTLLWAAVIAYYYACWVI